MKTPNIHIPSLIWPILFFVAGICVVSCDIFTQSGFFTSFGPFVLIVWGLYLFFRLHQLRFHLNLFLFLLLGAGITTFQENFFQQKVNQLDQDQVVTGTITEITSYERIIRIRIQIPRENWWEPSHYFIANLLDVNTSFQVGQFARIDRRLSPIPPPQYPYDFNARDYWWLHHTSHQIFLYHASDIQILHTPPSDFMTAIRTKTLQKMDTLYPNTNQSGILKALVAGEKSGLTREVKSHFKNAGLLHVLAVSGLHVGIVFGLLYVLLYPLHLFRIPQWLFFSIIVFGLWTYAVWTGMNIPVLRAVILMTFYLLASQIRRRVSSWNIYMWAVLIVLVLDPRSIFSVSMQLSFGAVAAILFFFKPFNRGLKRLLGQNYFSSLIAVSLAAQLGVLPFLLWHFQEVSLVSTISGLFVIPLLFPIILFTSVSLILPASWSWLISSTSKISQTLVQIIVDLSDVMANWSFSSLTLVWHPATILILSSSIILGGFSLAFSQHPRLQWLRTAPVALVCLTVIVEIGNIYQKRTTPYALVLKYNKESVTEFYYKGWCYTTLEEPAPPFIQKLRKRHYTSSRKTIKDPAEWQLLWSHLSPASSSQDRESTIIHITNYITNEHTKVDIRQAVMTTHPSTENYPTRSILPSIKTLKQ